jgi:hypothetical protein
MINLVIDEVWRALELERKSFLFGKFLNFNTIPLISQPRQCLVSPRSGLKSNIAPLRPKSAKVYPYTEI